MRGVYSITSGASHGAGNSRKLARWDAGAGDGSLDQWRKAGLIPYASRRLISRMPNMKKAPGDGGIAGDLALVDNRMIESLNPAAVDFIFCFVAGHLPC
jgi:hypothetical protein